MAQTLENTTQVIAVTNETAGAIIEAFVLVTIPEYAEEAGVRASEILDRYAGANGQSVGSTQMEYTARHGDFAVVRFY